MKSIDPKNRKVTFFHEKNFETFFRRKKVVEGKIVKIIFDNGYVPRWIYTGTSNEAFMKKYECEKEPANFQCRICKNTEMNICSDCFLCYRFNKTRK